MKPIHIPRPIRSLLSTAPVALAALLALATTVRAQTDNFDSGGLNPAAGWSQVTNPNFPYSSSFPTDVFGGHAFRLQAFVPLIYSSGSGTTRAAAVVTNVTYTDFYVAVDLVNWNSSTDTSTNDQFISLLARASGVDIGLLDAMVLLFQPNNRTQTSPPGPSVGALSVGWITGGSLAFLADPGAIPCNFTYVGMVPGHSYRLVFQGTGNEFTGRVYDLQDLTSPLMTVIGDNSIGAALFGSSPPTSGYSGICVANGDTAGVADATFDNFVAASAPPTSVSAPAVPHGLAGAPQVVNRTPASWSNFYSPAGGITFNATTLTTTNSINTNAIHLILNGIDVSSSLTITGPATNATVSFGGLGSKWGLASNCVYDASIQLQDMAGHTITNVWTFDTFSDAYLASANCLNIECEDYDYGGGQFIDNPAPSGFATNDNYATTGYWFPLYAGPSSIGYVCQIGNPANAGDPNYTGIPPFDFYADNKKPDYGGTFADIPQCEFRVAPGAANGDSVGTEEGAVFDIYGWHDLTQTFYGRKYDMLRQKYSSWTNNVQEYLVMATQGGDWFNYTRTFDGSQYYNVYLRHACAGSQQLNLYQIVGTDPTATTNYLGTFFGTNAMLWNFRYAPLLDTNNNALAVVNLTDVNTLRLEVGWFTPTNATANSTKDGLALNYLAFVPAGGAQLVTNVVYSTTNIITSISNNHNGTFTLNARGTPGAQYYMVTSGSIKASMTNWTALASSTNTASSPGGTWSCTVSGSAPAYYRSVAVNPHP
jgi:hypothetical protein